MCEAPKKIVIINGVEFIDVTNQTTAGTVMNYTEALAYTKGQTVATSR